MQVQWVGMNSKLAQPGLGIQGLGDEVGTTSGPGSKLPDQDKKQEEAGYIWARVQKRVGKNSELTPQGKLWEVKAGKRALNPKLDLDSSHKKGKRVSVMKNLGLAQENMGWLLQFFAVATVTEK